MMYSRNLLILPTLTIVKRLLRLARPFKRILALSIIAGFLGNLAVIGMFAASAKAAAAVLRNEPPLPFIAAALLCGIMRGPLRLGEHYWGHDTAFRLLASLRISIFTALQKIAPAGVIDKQNGEVLSAVIGDIEQIEVFFAHTISPVIVGFGISVTVLVHILLTDPILAAVLLPWHLFLGTVVPLISIKWMRKTGRAYRRGLSAVQASLLENLQGLKTLMLLKQDIPRLNTVLKKADTVESSRKTIVLHEGLMAAVSDAVVLLAVLTMLAAAAVSVMTNRIDPETAVYLTVLTLTSFGPLIQLTILSSTLSSTFSSAGRIFSLLDQKPAVVDTRCAKKSNRINGSPSLQDVTFSYPQTSSPVLQAQNISFLKGRITSIGGKSGMGKSTLLYLVMRFWDPESGEVRIHDTSVKHFFLQDLYRNISYISQDTFIFNTTVYENISIARPDAAEEEVYKAAQAAAVHREILQFPDGYRTKVGENGTSLSSGQRQRIGLARAFLQDTRILLLDEPTSNLDALNQKHILSSITETCREKTVLLVSHQESVKEACEFHIELQ